ncbi:serine/threonine-protein kinase S6KL [Venturia canescens]|uniref:serine/threonine-protein kinase S6KL n=1 Tax=Venturia canescens TaxID=32260 RepID=UPI001C9C3289|nr:serine/threonine-protein kinase S6KL [Venturia canescens]
MGNSSNKTYHRSRRKYASEYSLSDMIGGSCSGGRETIQTECYRPRSWVSRRSRSIGTLDDRLGSSKALWPVGRSEALFLPEFRVRNDPARSNYRILELIATGAYGRVYKVLKGSEDKIYALKMISKAKIIEENAVEQVKQEVSIQRIVGHHPFVTQILEHWQGRKTLYITMDYLGGGELFSLIEDYGCLPESVVRIYVGEIALALDFLHNAGIVHRDVKATNVLLDNEGHAVLIDFGLAKWLAPNQRTSTLCGTPEYMAPEILGREFYGHAVDWWSLGILACFALTNKYPQEPSRLFDPQTEERSSPDEDVVLPNNPEISTAAKDLLRRLLRLDPKTRLKSIFALQRVAFYMGHDIRGYVSKETSPLKLLGRTIVSSVNRVEFCDRKIFQDFDMPR